MGKKLLLTVLSFVSLTVVAQQEDPVLMTIGGEPVLRSEFEYIYNKNNSLNSAEKKSLKDYMQLFVDFKLKIAEAKRLGIDTTAAFKREYAGYRRQLSMSYLSDEKVDEAYARSYYNKLDSTHHASRIQMKHIFRYLPQSVSKSDVQKATMQMDSISEVLTRNPEQFDQFVESFSDDKRTLYVGYLQTPEDFENRIFSMSDGQISKPISSPQGIHIIKVLGRDTLPPFETIKDDILRRVTRIRGINPGTEAVAERLKKEYGFRMNEEVVKELFATGHTEKVLFNVGGNMYAGSEFDKFAQMYRRPVKEQLEAFTIKSVLDYENRRLEEKYPDFRLLMQEYREGMMLFELSNREVWQRAVTDTVGLEAYFLTHRKNYKWDIPRYAGVVLHSTDKKILKDARRLLKGVPVAEQAGKLEEFFNKGEQRVVVAESGVFMKGDNAFVDESVFKGDEVEPMEGYPYVRVFVKKQKYPDSYKEVRGQVVSDYQKFLEYLWLKRLRSEYKVEINQEVLKTVNNH